MIDDTKNLQDDSGDDFISLVPLNEKEEEKHRKLRVELAELGRDLVSATGDKGVIPLEHRENLSVADFEHFIVNYCLDMYRAHPEKTYSYVKTLRKHLDFGIEALENFRSGKTTEPALEIIPKAKLEELFEKLAGQLE